MTAMFQLGKLCGALAGAILLCAVPARAADATCVLRRAAQVDIETANDGRILVPVTLDDHPLSLMVDTGGWVSTLNPQVADQINHRQWSATVGRGVGDRKLTEYVKGKQFTLGRISGKQFLFLVEGKDFAFDGTLSPDILSEFDVDIDLVNGKLNMLKPDNCKGDEVVYWTKGAEVASIPIHRTPDGHMQIPVTINGDEILAIVDTGAVTSVMSMHQAEALGLNEKMPEMKLVGSNDKKDYRQYRYPFETLKFAGVTVNHPRIAIMSDAYMHNMRNGIILGMDVLRHLHLYIAYAQSTLYVTSALAH